MDLPGYLVNVLHKKITIGVFEMKKIINEVWVELKLVFLGKTMDILLPPILFLVLNSIYGLLVALIGSLLLSIFFLIKRLRKKDNSLYSFGGIIGIVFASLMVYLNDNASNFFLLDIISTGLLIVASVASLILKKPLAIWVSHITRGWDLEWFYREDVLPAYREVTIFWLVFFIVRINVEIYLYINASIEQLTVGNIILGYPLLIAVLTISYIYGITRLRKLNGPGIDEFRNGKQPPFRGQTRGF